MNSISPLHAQKRRILITDDDEGIRAMLTYMIMDFGHAALEADNGETALQVLKDNHVDLVLLDLHMPVMSGLEFLERFNSLLHIMPVIVITGDTSENAAIASAQGGASGFLSKPITRAELLHAIYCAQEKHRLRAPSLPTLLCPAAAHSLKDIMGFSAEVQKIVTQIEQVAQTNYTVIISGETGVGKEEVANSIHRNSRRASGPFTAVDCGSIAPMLIESELFGHEKGAFTGADRSRPGYFETAATGTLFLDEIGNLPLAMQAKLLRALQERQIYRVGGTTPIPLDVRVLAATNEELLAQVAAGAFRRDLYYRLDEFGIRVPPLRERVQDVLFLARRFLQAACEELGKLVPSLTSEVEHMLQAYPWPGNVRELRNLIRRAALISDGLIEERSLRSAGLSPLVTSKVRQSPSELTGASSFRELVRLGIEATEREILVQILGQTGGNMKQAARFLRLDYKTLRTKANKYGLNGQDF